MPNWCMNSVTIFHEDKNEIEKLVKSLETMEEYTFLRTLDESYEFREAHEVDWWREEGDENTIVASFDTAWSPPFTVYENLEGRGFEVIAEFYEPGMDFAGYYEDGDEITYQLSEFDDEWFLEDEDGKRLNECWDILSGRDDMDWEDVDFEEDE